MENMYLLTMAIAIASLAIAIAVDLVRAKITRLTRRGRFGRSSRKHLQLSFDG